MNPDLHAVLRLVGGLGDGLAHALHVLPDALERLTGGQGQNGQKGDQGGGATQGHEGPPLECRG